MNNFKVTFEKNEIIKNIEAIEEIEGRIEYLNNLLSVYYKIYEHESEDDILSYLREQDIRIPNNNYQPFLNNVWESPNYVDDKIENFKFMSMKFKEFIKEMLQLIRFTELKLTHYSSANDIYHSKEYLIFDENLFLHKLKTFNDAKSAYSWTLKYVILISDISLFLDNYLYKKLYERCNLSEYFPEDKYSSEKSIYKYQTFIDHLRENLLPIIRRNLNRIEVEKDVKNAKLKYPDKFSSDLEKFPDYDFDYLRITEYSFRVFRTPEEKLEYFLHIVRVYDRMIGYNDIIPGGAEKCVAQLKKEIENYKEIVKLKLTVKKGPEILPVSVDTSKITDKIDKISQELDELSKKKVIITKDKRKILFFNHYLNIAFQIKDIPRQNDLITKLYNKTYISRKFKNKDFLVDLAEFLKSKLEDQRFKPASREIIINCNNFISKILIKDVNEDDMEKYLNHRDELHNISNKPKKKKNEDLFKGDDDMKFLTGEEGIME
ncbi:MAG: hypothetical protein WC644_10825 [Ignavibacteria bacterium]